MEIRTQVAVIELTRQEQLELWMKRAGVTYRALGSMVGITGGNAARRLNSETIPPGHHGVWSRVVPLDLLPPPLHLKPGRKPRAEAQAQVA